MKNKPLFDFWGYFPMGDKYVVLHHLKYGHTYVNFNVPLSNVKTNHQSIPKILTNIKFFFKKFKSQTSMLMKV